MAIEIGITDAAWHVGVTPDGSIKVLTLLDKQTGIKIVVPFADKDAADCGAALSHGHVQVAQVVPSNGR